MSIIVSCACGKTFKTRDEFAGRKARCPACNEVLVIPAPVEAEDHDPYEVKEEAAPPPRLVARPIAAPAPAVEAAPAPSFATTTGQTRVSGLSPRSGRPLREWLYVALSLTLLPLLWSTMHAHHTTIGEQLRQTIKAHPEVRDSIVKLSEDGDVSTSALFNVLPDHRLDGALLAYGSKLHWLYALMAAGAFFGLALLMMPADTTEPKHVFFTGLFTGTAGVLLLLAVQFIASMMRGRIIIPRSIAGLFLLILKGIQLSYDAADDPSTNFFVSAFGFTFGVGLCEELCKALPLLWHYRHKATLDWRGACLWGFLSGVGFGVAEGIMYSGDMYNGIVGGSTYLVRFVSCVGLHGIWAAAAGIFICKHQTLAQSGDSWYGVMLNSAVLVSAPMVLHGLYDTMLKKDMNAAAMVVALISFGWLVFQIEHARRGEEKHGAAAYA